MQSFADLGAASSSTKSKRAAFDYWYHRDSHTSLVGVREVVPGHHRCFRTDAEVETWLDTVDVRNHSGGHGTGARLGLFAFPGQSNMTGRRLPKSW